MWVFSEADDNIRYVNKDEEKLIEEEEEVERNGELLFCGGTSWDTLTNYGHPDNTYGNLISPTRLTPLIGVNIRDVAAGCASSHCVALDVEGRVYTWGKNKRGQLGHGDMINRDRPTIVSGLSGHKIIKAGAGRAHTVVVTNDGKSFAFGWNKHGQCGTGSARTEFQQSPVSSQVSEVTNVVCGGDFTVWLSSVEGSSILTAGLPQYGQLGHGTDNEYNTKSSAVNLAYEAQPHPKAIAAFAGKKIVKVACGTNHTVAVDSEGVVYTWGYGAYGRLGHREPKDEWTPRVVALFQKKNVLPPNAIVAAGAHNCAVTAGGGQLYMWGKLKVTGEDCMYPKPLLTLSGWNIRCMDSGATHNFVGAEKSCISWGGSQYGELGYGPEGPKSATNPKKVDVLEGMHVMSVACGSYYSLVVVDRTNVGDKLDQLDVYEGKPFEEGTADAKAKSPGPKKGGAETPSNKRKKSKDLSESAEPKAISPAPKKGGSDDDENGHVEERKRVGGKQGRGNGAKSPAAGKASGRGRGRPPSAEKKSTQPRGGGSGGKRGRPRKS
ncbi:protein RCC2-like [Papaver somniferum]|nr:protein RCC2-like [Papaver somniferum]